MLFGKYMTFEVAPSLPGDGDRKRYKAQGTFKRVSAEFAFGISSANLDPYTVLADRFVALAVRFALESADDPS